RDAEAVRRTVGGAGDAHQSAFTLHDGVVPRLLPPRSGLSKARHGTVDEPREFRRDRRVVEAELRERARPKVLDDDVRLRKKAVEHGASLRMLEIERDAFFVPVDAEKVRALALEK